MQCHPKRSRTSGAARDLLDHERRAGAKKISNLHLPHLAPAFPVEIAMREYAEAITLVASALPTIYAWGLAKRPEFA
jgi:hypothetical protein